MIVSDLVRAMEAIAPTRFAAPWDNVGLLVGDGAAPMARVLLAVDTTSEVLGEAVRERCEAVVSYHPPIFGALKGVVAGSVAYEAVRRGLAIYSPHTALDVADGGTNDVLADSIGMAPRAPLRLVEAADARVKLVTFVPADHVEAVSRAVFAAGAGEIGNYSACSYRSTGTGTFFGEEGARPAVGAAGRLEEVAEVRLETVVPTGAAEEVVRALRAAHPYEEPAFDLVRLADPTSRGLGRVGPVPRAPARALVEKAKAALGLATVLVAGPLNREVSRAAVCAGSGGDLVADAIASGAELLLTGELKHHDVLHVVAAGLVAVCTRHSSSERPALAALRARLESLLPGVQVVQSSADREPLDYV
ncbi:MAG TPA: Nif3-like dinuclear metal center hexameric protein [Polyangiaceae bacterium]|nr:Nif3-like dinuclear metal center hexameric protein [Polyangiaceae bacterium]